MIPGVGRRKRRRGSGEGTVYQRKDGRWEARLWAETPAGRRRLTKTTRSRKEAQDWLTVMRAKSMAGPLATPEAAKTTVADILRLWLESPEAKSLAPSTYEQYERMCRVHLVPELGRCRIAQLGPETVERAYAHMAARGSGERTVEYAHTVLRKALSAAVRWGLVDRNAAALAKRPKRAAGEQEERVRVLSPEEQERFLRAAEGSRFEHFFRFALYTGLRVGEILALAEEDADLASDPASVTIRRALAESRGGYYFSPTKRKASRRRVMLLEEAARALSDQVEQLQKERLSPRWSEHGLLFPSSVGTPMSRHNLYSRYFRPLLEEAGLPPITLHDLRHTFASRMLYDYGVDAGTVSHMLGHASIKTTLDIYGHLVPRTQAATIRRLNELLRNPVAGNEAGRGA